MINSTEQYYENKELTSQYKYLVRKIDDTRRSRYQTAKRLRSEQEWRSKLILFYNILIIILSIITLYNFFTDHFPIGTYIILAFSISLSLYSTHLAGKSRLELAGIMNQNANALSHILSEVQSCQLEKLTTKKHLKKLRRLTEKYESTIDNVENHAPIDYMVIKTLSKGKETPTVIVYTLDKPTLVISAEMKAQTSTKAQEFNYKSSSENLYEIYDKAVKKYNQNEKQKRIVGYAGGSILALFILFYPTFVNVLSILLAN